MNLLELVLEKTDQAETPKSFFYWSTLAAMSSIVKRNVWINKRIYKLYPNLYILLIAKSGLRKGAATSLAKSLVEKVQNTRVIYGRSSIQAIIKELSDQRTFPNGYVLNSASGFIVSGELASSIIGDTQSQTILTDLYDSNYHSEWTNTLKGSGKEKLREIYVTFLAATNPTLLEEFLEESSIQGGFIARTILIKEDRKARINALIDDDALESVEFDDAEILVRLREIANVKGQFKFSDSAKHLYKEWYEAFNGKLERGEIRDSTGTADRLHDHILKVAMLLSLSDNLSLVIDERHMIEAINNLTGDAVRVAESISTGKGKSELAVKTKIFLDELIAAPEYRLSREEMLRRRFKDFDAYELDRIVETLSQGGAIQVQRGTDAKVYYNLAPKYATQIERLVRK
jgi:hypothetical protein